MSTVFKSELIDKGEFSGRPATVRVRETKTTNLVHRNVIITAFPSIGTYPMVQLKFTSGEVELIPLRFVRSIKWASEEAGS